MTAQTKAQLQAQIEDLKIQLAVKSTAALAGYVAFYRNNERRTAESPLGYMLIDVPEGVRKLRVVLWKPDREVVNSRGERALLTGQVTAVRTPGRIDQPAIPADEEPPFDDDIGF